MANALVTAVADFSGSVSQTDDQTILVVKRAP